MVFLPLYAFSVGLSLTESSTLFGVHGLTSFLSKPIMGRVSDQVGRRPCIIFGLVMCGVTVMSIPHATQFLPLFFLAAGFGFGEAVMTSSSAALLADLAGPENVGAGMGLCVTIMDIRYTSSLIGAGVLVAAQLYWNLLLIGSLQFLAAMGFGIMTCRQTTV